MRALTNHQLLNSSESAEWFTPPCYIEAAREVLGAIDLDPASCEAANRIVQADRYYTEADNGYAQEWRGNLFLNPPYGWCCPDGRRKEKGGISSQGHWSGRLIEQYQAGTVTEAILLINANTGEQWFQALWDFPICFVNRRIRFIPGEGTDPRKQPTKSNAFVYFGLRPARFREVFRQFGPVVTPEVLMIAPLQGCQAEILSPAHYK
jgi:ParB family chromosome partitioning protein